MPVELIIYQHPCWLLEAAELSPLLPAQHEPKPTV